MERGFLCYGEAFRTKRSEVKGFSELGRTFVGKMVCCMAELSHISKRGYRPSTKHRDKRVFTPGITPKMKVR